MEKAGRKMYMEGISSVMLFSLVFAAAFAALLLFIFAFRTQRLVLRVSFFVGVFVLVVLTVTFYVVVQRQNEARAEKARVQVYQKVEDLQKAGQEMAAEAAASVLEENTAGNDLAPLAAENTGEDRDRNSERRFLGRQLGGIEMDLRGQTAGYMERLEAINVKYRNGEIDSYEQLNARAQLEIEKQNAIIAAMDEKMAALAEAQFLTAADKEKDLAAIRERKQQAEKMRREYQAVLQQVEMNKDIFHSL